MKAKGGWEVKCVPVALAREITRRNIDDRMWFDRAEAKDQWVRVRRPKNKPDQPFQSFSLCGVGGSRSSAEYVIHFPGKRERHGKRKRAEKVVGAKRRRKKRWR